MLSCWWSWGWGCVCVCVCVSLSPDNVLSKVNVSAPLSSLRTETNLAACADSEAYELIPADHVTAGETSLLHHRGSSTVTTNWVNITDVRLSVLSFTVSHLENMREQRQLLMFNPSTLPLSHAAAEVCPNQQVLLCQSQRFIPQLCLTLSSSLHPSSLNVPVTDCFHFKPCDLTHQTSNATPLIPNTLSVVFFDCGTHGLAALPTV